MARLQALGDEGAERSGWRLFVVRHRSEVFAIRPGRPLRDAEEVASDLRAIVERAELPSKRVRQSRRAVVAAIAASVGLGAIGGGLWAYIAKGPASAELLYQQALEEYDRGQYDKAVVTFSKCLERRSGWPDVALRPRPGQRKLSKWTEARSDFIALKDANAAWSYALAGYCNMRAEDEVAASIDFMDGATRVFRMPDHC